MLCRYKRSNGSSRSLFTASRVVVRIRELYRGVGREQGTQSLDLILVSKPLVVQMASGPTWGRSDVSPEMISWCLVAGSGVPEGPTLLDPKRSALR